MKRNDLIRFTWLLLAALLLLSCGRRFDVRPAGPDTDRSSPLFPDYTDVTIPCNIAPLNFYYTDPAGSRFTTTFSAGDMTVTLRGREVVWKEKQWTRLMAAVTGSDITVYFCLVLTK